MNQPLKWHGGKHYLAKRIVDLMPPHKRYLEAYSGGLSVLFAKPCDDVAEWANDTNGELITFWRVISHPNRFNAFKRMVEATPLSQWHFENAEHEATSLFLDGTDPMIALAWRFFVKMRQSRQGLGEDYCTPTRRTRRGMNEQVSAWLSAIEGLAEVHERLKRVEIWAMNAPAAIKKLDGNDFLTYCDPPYLHSTRSSTGEYGEHELTPAQHVELLDTLAGMKGKFLLSGYRSELYDGYAEEEGWIRHDFELPNHASGSKSKERKIECVWMNYEPELIDGRS